MLMISVYCLFGDSYNFRQLTAYSVDCLMILLGEYCSHDTLYSRFHILSW